MLVWKRLGGHVALGVVLGLCLAVAAPTANAVTLPWADYNDNTVPRDSAAELNVTDIRVGLLGSGRFDTALNSGNNTLASDPLTLAFNMGNSLPPRGTVRSILRNDANFVASTSVCGEGPDADCDAYTTPIPGAIWLLASALLGLLGFGARRRAVA